MNAVPMTSLGLVPSLGTVADGDAFAPALSADKSVFGDALASVLDAESAERDEEEDPVPLAPPLPVPTHVLAQYAVEVNSATMTKRADGDLPAIEEASGAPAPAAKIENGTERPALAIPLGWTAAEPGVAAPASLPKALEAPGSRSAPDAPEATERAASARSMADAIAESAAVTGARSSDAADVAETAVSDLDLPHGARITAANAPLGTPFAAASSVNAIESFVATSAPNIASTSATPTVRPRKVGEAPPAPPEPDANAPATTATRAGAVAEAANPQAPPKPDTTTLRPAKKKAPTVELEAAENVANQPASLDAPFVPPVVAQPTAAHSGAHVKTLTTAADASARPARDAEQAVRAAESLGHKRVLAAGEAHGQVVVPELGRVDVRALRDEKGGELRVHVHADDAHGRAVIAAHAPELRAHVQAEVPQAQVNVERHHGFEQGNAGSREHSEPQHRDERHAREDVETAIETTVRRSIGRPARFVL